MLGVGGPTSSSLGTGDPVSGAGGVLGAGTAGASLTGVVCVATAGAAGASTAGAVCVTTTGAAGAGAVCTSRAAIAVRSGIRGIVARMVRFRRGPGCPGVPGYGSFRTLSPTPAATTLRGSPWRHVLLPLGASAVTRCAVRSRASSPVTLRRLAPRKDCHEAWSHVSALCRPHP